MTRRQYECMKFIETFIKEKGYSPSHDEIAKELRIVKSGAWRIVTSLKELGKIKTVPNKKRTIEIAE